MPLAISGLKLNFRRGGILRPPCVNFWGAFGYEEKPWEILGSPQKPWEVLASPGEALCSPGGAQESPGEALGSPEELWGVLEPWGALEPSRPRSELFIGKGVSSYLRIIRASLTASAY